MTQKESKTGNEIIAATPTKLREIAEMIRFYADKYEAEATRMTAAGVETIPLSGVPTLEDKVFVYLRGNTNKLNNAVSHEIDARKIALICDQREAYEISSLPTDPVQTQKKKRQ